MIHNTYKHLNQRPKLLEDQASPVVVFFLLFEGEPKGGSLPDEQGSVGGVEAAEDETGAWSHLLTHGRHIGQKNVAIDVGQNEVERPFHLI